MTRETVCVDTPAADATSLIVSRPGRVCIVIVPVIDNGNDNILANLISCVKSGYVEIQLFFGTAANDRAQVIARLASCKGQRDWTLKTLLNA